VLVIHEHGRCFVAAQAEALQMKRARVSLPKRSA
jgi:hypothetical protein